MCCDEINNSLFNGFVLIVYQFYCEVVISVNLYIYKFVYMNVDN